MDPKTKRPIELAMILHAENKGISLEKAAEKKRTACDGVFVVQVFRDNDVLSFMTASHDGHTGEKLSVEELFQMWVSMAGHIAQHDDASTTKASKQRRFVLTVLQQLKLSADLGRAKDGEKVEMPLGVDAVTSSD